MAADLDVENKEAQLTGRRGSPQMTEMKSKSVREMNQMNLI